MSVMSRLYMDIEELLERGTMSFEEIATLLEVPVSWVAEVAEQQYYGA